jgi:hypothetical protein
MSTTPHPASRAEDAPIACTLPPSQYASRTAELSALAGRALRSREQSVRGERLTFEAGEQVERELGRRWRPRPPAARS